jgi:hypothetical protein
MLEKHGGSQITFFQWFKIGLLCTVVSGALAIGALLIFAPHMPDQKITFQKLSATSKYVPVSAEFPAELTGTVSKINGRTYLVGAKDAKIQVVLPADAKFDGKVKVAGTIVKDASNKDYPYMMKAQKVTELKKD